MAIKELLIATFDTPWFSSDCTFKYFLLQYTKLLTVAIKFMFEEKPTLG
jgi:hypothetical protein